MRSSLPIIMHAGSIATPYLYLLPLFFGYHEIAIALKCTRDGNFDTRNMTVKLKYLSLLQDDTGEFEF